MAAGPLPIDEATDVAPQIAQGLAKLVEATRVTTPATAVGTVFYRSPEQGRAEIVGGGVALAALLYYYSAGIDPPPATAFRLLSIRVLIGIAPTLAVVALTGFVVGRRGQ